MPVIEAGPYYSDDGKPPRPAPSDGDGKRGTKLMPDSKAGAHIYYRLYTKNGPLESNNPIFSNDRFISRISSRSVRPPHTAASIKNYLCKIEGFRTAGNCFLYSSLSEQTPLEDSTRLSIRATSGPGSSEPNPMALIVDTRAVEKRSQATSATDPPKLLEWDHEQPYVYYLVYDEDGEVLSKTSFREDSPFLGRINTLSVPPPRTVSSLKCHLIESERILAHNVQLFEDEGGESTMNDSDVIALVSDTFPGSREDQPIAIAYESQKFGRTASDDHHDLGSPTDPVKGEDPAKIQARELHEAPSELAQRKEVLQKSNETYTDELARLREELDKMKETHSRELGENKSVLHRLKQTVEKLDEAAFSEGASPAQLQALSERPSFTTKLKATADDKSRYSSWHSIKTGDILYTDGICIKQDCYPRFGCDSYNAINASGKLAFVMRDATALCWAKMAP